MANSSGFTVLLIFAGLIFLLGVVSILAGFFIIVFRAASGDVKTLAIQTSRLAQKGMAEEVVGLVAHASDLVSAMDQLVRTTRGIGLLLIGFGTFLIAGACFLTYEALKLQI